MKTKEKKFGQTPIETSPMTKDPTEQKEHIQIVRREKMGPGLYNVTIERWIGCHCSAVKDTFLMRQANLRLPTKKDIMAHLGI